MKSAYGFPIYDLAGNGNTPSTSIDNEITYAPEYTVTYIAGN
jgi:hypothetical protein